MITGKKVETAKILVVDDEPEITEIVEVFLKTAGYDVMVENSGDACLERAKSYQPDLILLDIMMPKTDGYEVCDRLKKNQLTQNIPVIFLTGKDARHDEGRSFRVGGDMFVKKPFSCERLLDIIKIVLSSINR